MASGPRPTLELDDACPMRPGAKWNELTPRDFVWAGRCCAAPVLPGEARRDTATLTQMGRRMRSCEMRKRTEACRARPSRTAACPEPR